MHFLTQVALLATVAGLQLASAAPNPAASQPADTPTETITAVTPAETTVTEATGGQGEGNGEGININLSLPAGYTGVLKIHTTAFLDYAKKNNIQLPWVVTTVLEAAPDPLVRVKAGDGECEDPIPLPEGSGLDGEICAPSGSFDPKALQGLQQRACSGRCYGSCVDHLFDGTYDTCLAACIRGDCPY